MTGIGDLVTIEARAVNGKGSYLSPYADPLYLAFVEKCCDHLTSDDQKVSATYKWVKQPPDNRALMKLVLERTEPLCNPKVEAYAEFTPAPCTTDDFAGDYMTYECKGVSPYLNKLCEETGKEWKLIIDWLDVIRVVKYGTTKPPTRDYEEIVKGWYNGVEVSREFCTKDNNWYWVYVGAKLTEVPHPLECFIATAAYGSPLAPEVQTLRQFRDTRLPGWFIRAYEHPYYLLSKPITPFISRHNTIKSAVRLCLTPFIKLLRYIVK